VVPPLLAHFRLGEQRDGQPDPISLNPLPLPFAEIQQLQDAVARAHRQVEMNSSGASIREPARRRAGGRRAGEGMLTEEVVAAVGSLGGNDGDDIPDPEIAASAEALDLGFCSNISEGEPTDWSRHGRAH